MSTRKRKEIFSKDEWNEEEVQAVADSHLDTGAVRCARNDTDDDYVLVCTWNIID